MVYNYFSMVFIIDFGDATYSLLSDRGTYLVSFVVFLIFLTITNNHSVLRVTFISCISRPEEGNYLYLNCSIFVYSLSMLK